MTKQHAVHEAWLSLGLKTNQHIKMTSLGQWEKLEFILYITYYEITV